MRRMVFSIHGHPRAATDAFRPEEVVGNGYRVLIVAFVMQDRFRKPHRVGRVCRSRRPVVVVVRGKGDLRWRRAHVICEKKVKLNCTHTFGDFFLPSTQPISVSGPHLPFSWQVSDGLEGRNRLWPSQENVNTSP